MLVKDMTDEEFKKYISQKYPDLNLDLDGSIEITQVDYLRLKEIQKELLDEVKRKTDNSEQ